MPKIVDPMNDAFEMRKLAGDVKKANPKANVPVETVFRLQQRGNDIRGQAPSEPSEASYMKPPKAVYVKRNRKELYDHKLELRPFNWDNKKDAKNKLDTFLNENK